MLTRTACFARGIEPVDLDQGSSIPLGFVFQLADELTPSHITESFRQAVVLDHVLDRQALHAHHLVFVHHACAELMLVVPSAVIDPSMKTSHFETGFVPILGALLFLGMASLSLCQLLLLLGKIARIANTLPSRKGNHRLDAQVKSHHVVHHGQGLDLLFEQDGHEVAVRAILGNRDRTGLGIFGQRSMPVPRDAQRDESK